MDNACPRGKNSIDNSAANQRWINGVQLASRDSTWGERTDERCLSFLYVTF